MKPSSCRIDFPTATLVGYWLGELDGAAEAQLEEHLFACAHCSDRLDELVQLGKAVCDITRSGDVQAITTPAFVKRLQRAGVRVREYRMQPGGSVMCTVTSQDDLVIAHLHAPLRDVQRLDVVLHDLTAGKIERLDDVAFDPVADEIILTPSMAELRQLDVATLRVELLAIDAAGERVIGEYTFNHSATRE